MLDVPPHPSLPVPERLGDPALDEGDAVTMTLGRDRLGAWRVVRVEGGELHLVDAAGMFRWPVALAPPSLGRGDRLTITLELDEGSRERNAAAIRALRERAESR